MPAFYIKGKFSFRRTLELKVPAGSGHVSDQFGCHSFWGIFDIFLPEFVYVFLIHLGSLLSVIIQYGANGKRSQAERDLG